MMQAFVRTVLFSTLAGLLLMAFGSLARAQEITTYIQGGLANGLKIRPMMTSRFGSTNSGCNQPDFKRRFASIGEKDRAGYYCEQESRICLHRFLRHDISLSARTRAYSQCAKSLWEYAQAKNWDAIYNLTRDGTKQPVTQNLPVRPIAEPTRNQDPPQLSPDATGYVDIDDLSTDDIDVLEVRDEPATNANAAQRYCICRADHDEIYGWCAGPDGWYKQGHYPWTTQCKQQVFK